MLKSKEQREYDRYEMRQTLSFRTQSASDHKLGKTCNLSKKGILLETSQKISQGEELELIINIDQQSVHFKGRCIYCLKAGANLYQAGILILQINTEGLEAFLALIEKLKTEKRQINLALSPETGAINNLVQRVASEHKIISQYVVVLQKALDEAGGTPLHLGELETVLLHMKKALSTHFYVEEKVFFKIGLTSLPTEYHGLIMELSQDHSVLVHELKTLTTSAQEGMKKGSPWGAKEKGDLEKFLLKVKTHARKELTEFFPILESNENAKAQIMKVLRNIIDV
ncbi:hemerythrin domain-containing protein [Desulfoluna sp.]|uniref:hemerythrin domain-containing protein n=1 Tax=Desulfoluna sp. TaxID=2045199 RepID=UPI00261D7577|nr:hemerythrin domain-containing protein [Desulfoluna sp.]